MPTSKTSLQLHVLWHWPRMHCLEIPPGLLSPQDLSSPQAKAGIMALNIRDTESLNGTVHTLWVSTTMQMQLMCFKYHGE